MYIIHPDYVLGSDVPKSDDIHRQQKAAAYTDRDAYMQKQDPVKPVFVGHDVWCNQGTKKEDVVAAIEFMKIERAQFVKFNWGQGPLNAVDRMIKDLQEIDERSPRPAIRVDALPSKQ